MSALHRLYSDYFLPNRLGEFEKLISTALEAGYTHVTIPEFYELIKSGSLDQSKKYFIHRHDIDTDVSTARSIFEVEQKCGIRSSWYFRLSTLNSKLMNDIRNTGSEVGYHYEELAQYCKDHRIKSQQGARNHFSDITGIFKKNFHTVEKKAGFKIKTIASHGDFVNRKIDLTNFSFITRELMDELGIELECYDDVLLKNYGTILSDYHYPIFYKPRNPLDCIKEGHKVIYLLSHPRHWRATFWANTKDNLQRLIEGIKYSA